MKDVLMAAQIAQSVVTTLAILFGGLWTYFRFFRGRTFHPRINLSVSGSTRKRGDKTYVSVSIKVENKGNAAVHIDHDRTYVAVHNEHGQPGFGEHVDVVPVLRSCYIVEPQEGIVDEQLSCIDVEPDIVLRLVFHVQSKRYLSWRGLRVSRWGSSVLVNHAAIERNPGV